MVGLVVFAAYCIWKGAYFALNYRAGRYIGLLMLARKLVPQKDAQEDEEDC